MYAILEIGGKQFKVEENQEISIPKAKVKDGDIVEFDNVLLYSKDGNTEIGKPKLDSVSVSAKVINEEEKGDKLVVFKMKRRKGFRKKLGHRQKYSRVLIEKINVS